MGYQRRVHGEVNFPEHGTLAMSAMHEESGVDGVPSFDLYSVASSLMARFHPTWKRVSSHWLKLQCHSSCCTLRGYSSSGLYGRQRLFRSSPLFGSKPNSGRVHQTL